MTWSAVLLALLVAHGVGDVLLQSDRQARDKGRGIGDRRARHALVTHVSLYTLADVPALLWIAAHAGVGRAILVGGLIAVPHAVIDEGRIVHAWLREVKRAPDPPPALVIAVDQCLHLVCLFGASLVAVA